MSRKFSKLLMLFISLCTPTCVGAIDLNNVETSSICKPVDKISNEKFADFRQDLLDVISEFENCYISLHNVRLKINNWFSEIEQEDGFENLKRKILIGRRGLMGGSYDIVNEFYNNLPEDRRQDFDYKADMFRNDLLEIIRKQKEIFFDYDEKIKSINKNFSYLSDSQKLGIKKYLISNLENNLDEVRYDISKWEEFLNNKKFYEHKVHVGCRFSYDEDWLEYDIDSNSKTDYFSSEKSKLLSSVSD